MGRAMERPTSQVNFEDAKIPRPSPEGATPSRAWVDGSTGSWAIERARAEAAERVEPFLMGRERCFCLPIPSPAEIPEPVPGGVRADHQGDSEPAGKRASPKPSASRCRRSTDRANTGKPTEQRSLGETFKYAAYDALAKLGPGEG